MAKYYPPNIEGVLPAFTYQSRSGNIVVPFSMNKTVSFNSISGFAIRVKTVQSNQLVYYQKVITNSDINEIEFPIQSSCFQGKFNSFIVGQHYKIQVAYIDADTEEIGYYSTVGIAKCTTQPRVYIEGLKEAELQSDRGTYVGVYKNTGDITEKLYSYYFNLLDTNGKIIYTTGELIHNCENDEEVNYSTDEFQLTMGLEENKVYQLEYGGTTLNGLKVKVSSPYRIVKQSSIPPDIKASIKVEMNKDNGYVQIHIIGDENPITGIEENGIGTFQILRSSEAGEFVDWQIIHKFVLFGSKPSMLNLKDFTVEQGKTYQYALQQYNNSTNIISNKILSNYVTVDFEDCFLYDGERQLKIKYNPKISSFKETLLEAKTNTLGGKYPFVFRNGNVSYKEFPISGLVSYLMDEEHLFITEEEMGINNRGLSYARTETLDSKIHSLNTKYFENLQDIFSLEQTNRLQTLYKNREIATSKEYEITHGKRSSHTLEDYNRAAERIFKLKVLEFLNDGKPKLFRSATEGNYIVRLMNSSLSPNDQLGRMLHTFSTTATEVQPFSTPALEEMNIVTTKELVVEQMRWETVLLKDLEPKPEEEWIQINKYVAISLQCLDMIPGTRVRITFAKTTEEPEEIRVGVTGAYFGDLKREISKIEIHKDILNISTQGQITYGYYGRTFNHFDTYKSFDINDIPVMQFIGSKIVYDESKEADRLVGVKEQLTDIRNIITSFKLLHFGKREVQPVYKFNIDIDGETSTRFYSTTNISPNDIDYSAFTTTYNLADWYYQKGKKDNWIYDGMPKYLIPINEFVEDNYTGSKDSWFELDLDAAVEGRKITALKAAIPRASEGIECQPLYIYYETNLQPQGTFRQITNASDTVYITNFGDEHITKLRFHIPGLSVYQKRRGYFSFETYWEFDDEKAYLDTFKDSVQITEFNPFVIYKVVNTIFNDSEIYYDGYNNSYVNYSNVIKLDDFEVDITATEEYYVSIPEDIKEVYIPSGVFADVGVQRRTINYSVEEAEGNEVKPAKQLWLKCYAFLIYLIYNSYAEERPEVYQLPDTLPSDWDNDQSVVQNILKIQDNLDLELKILSDSGTCAIDYSTALELISNKEQEYYKKYLTQVEKAINILVGSEQ